MLQRIFLWTIAFRHCWLMQHCIRDFRKSRLHKELGIDLPSYRAPAGATGTVFAGRSSEMKIAIPNWQGRVSPVFDVAGSLLLFHVNGQDVLRREELPLRGYGLAARAEELAALEVDVLICGAISRALLSAISASGVLVIPKICGPVEEILRAYLHDCLTDCCYRMPQSRDGARNHSGRVGERDTS